MTRICFHNFRLFDGLHERLLKNRLVVVQDGRIFAVDELEALPRYQDHQAVDLNGLTMLPGLIDAHVHLTVPLGQELNLAIILQMGRQVAMNFTNCLKYGVTTVRDVGAFSRKMRSWRRRIESGRAPGPRILTCLSFITSQGGVPEMVPTLNPLESLVAGGQFVERRHDPAAVHRTAETLVNQGADWLKTQYSEESFLFHGRLNNLSDACFAALMDVSYRRGVPVAMHHTETAGFRKGLMLGVNSLEHCAMEELTREDVDHLVAKGISLVPTLKALGDYVYLDSVMDWLSGEGRGDFLPEPYRQTTSGVELLSSSPYPPADYQKQFYADVDMLRRGYPATLKNVEKIMKAGGRVGVGTDSCGTGLSFSGQYWKELWHLTQAGFSNFAALEAATRINAEIIGLDQDVGSIEPGKLADLTIVDGNPLTDIETVKNVRAVYKGGVQVV